MSFLGKSTMGPKLLVKMHLSQGVPSHPIMHDMSSVWETSSLLCQLYFCLLLSCPAQALFVLCCVLGGCKFSVSIASFPKVEIALLASDNDTAMILVTTWIVSHANSVVGNNSIARKTPLLTNQLQNKFDSFSIESSWTVHLPQSEKCCLLLRLSLKTSCVGIVFGCRITSC